MVQIFHPFPSYSLALCLSGVDFSGTLPVPPLWISAVPVALIPLVCWTAPAGSIASCPKLVYYRVMWGLQVVVVAALVQTLFSYQTAPVQTIAGP